MVGKIYYYHTDSLVNYIILADNKVNPKEIDKLKLQYVIVKGIFISV